MTMKHADQVPSRKRATAIAEIGVLLALGALVVLAIVVGSSSGISDDELDNRDVDETAAEAPVDAADAPVISLPAVTTTSTTPTTRPDPTTPTPTSRVLSSTQTEPNDSAAPPPSTTTTLAIAEDESTAAVADDRPVPEPAGMAVVEGPFVAIDVGERLVCGLRTDGHAECWDSFLNNSVQSSNSRFSFIGIGGATGCGLRADGAVECWGLWEAMRDVGEGTFAAGEGPFTTFAVSWDTVCAVRFDGVVICSENEFELYPHKPLAVDVVSVAARELVFCAITTSGDAVCWDYWQEAGFEPSPLRAEQPPAGPFERLFVGDQGEVACGLRQDQSIACWGDTAAGVGTDGSVEHFSQLAVGRSHSCGLRLSGAIACWDHFPDGRQAAPVGSVPSGDFVDVSIGRTSTSYVPFTCAVRVSGELMCWHADFEEPRPVPRGEFTAIDTTHEVSCALRRDGAMVCWRQRL